MGSVILLRIDRPDGSDAYLEIPVTELPEMELKLDSSQIWRFTLDNAEASAPGDEIVRSVAEAFGVRIKVLAE